MQFTVVLVLFLVIEIVVGLIGFLQATQARSSFKRMTNNIIKICDKMSCLCERKITFDMKWRFMFTRSDFMLFTN